MQKKIIKSKAYKYEQITKYILENIKRGSLLPGDRLPSVRRLAADMHCNYLTIYRSFKDLEKMGVVEKRRGSGTYVKQTMMDISSTLVNNHVILPVITDKIGVLLIPGHGGPYMNALLKALHDTADEKKLTLNIRTVTEYSSRNIAQIKSLRNQGCCAVVIPWCPEEQDLAAIHSLVNMSPVPVVLPLQIHGLEKNCPEYSTESGTSPNSHAVTACKYFLKLGYSNIALLGVDTEFENHPFHRMMMDYTRFVNYNYIQSHIGLIRSNVPEDYDRVVSGWKKFAGDLAVVCYFDEMAVRLMAAIHRCGLKVPEDIAVMGYNNIEAGEFADPPLSTIQCPYNAIAERMLLHALAMCGDTSRKIEYPFAEELVIRDSCGWKLRPENSSTEICESMKEQAAAYCQV